MNCIKRLNTRENLLLDCRQLLPLEQVANTSIAKSIYQQTYQPIINDLVTIHPPVFHTP